MADAVGLVFIDKDHLVRFRDGLCATNVMQVHATVGEHHVRGDSALLVGLMPARTSTHHIPDRYRLAQHQRSRVNVSHLEVSHSVTACQLNRDRSRQAQAACAGRRDTTWQNPSETTLTTNPLLCLA